MNNIYDFEVKLTPVYTADNETGIQVPNKAAVVKSESGQIIGLVSTKYQLN